MTTRKGKRAPPRKEEKTCISSIRDDSMKRDAPVTASFFFLRASSSSNREDQNKNVFKNRKFFPAKECLCGEAEEYSSMRVSRDERENFARGRGNARNTARDVCFFLSFSIRVRNVRFLIKMINDKLLSWYNFLSALSLGSGGRVFSLFLFFFFFFFIVRLVNPCTILRRNFRCTRRQNHRR